MRTEAGCLKNRKQVRFFLCVFRLGWKGNLCERSLWSSLSLLILLPCAALAVYYLLLQTFVLRLEVLLSAVLLCFYGLEFLLGLVCLSAFSRYRQLQCGGVSWGVGSFLFIFSLASFCFSSAGLGVTEERVT